MRLDSTQGTACSQQNLQHSSRYTLPKAVFGALPHTCLKSSNFSNLCPRTHRTKRSGWVRLSLMKALASSWQRMNWVWALPKFRSTFLVLLGGRRRAKRSLRPSCSTNIAWLASTASSIFTLCWKQSSSDSESWGGGGCSRSDSSPGGSSAWSSWESMALGMGMALSMELRPRSPRECC